jgi:FkbH-like protein
MYNIIWENKSFYAQEELLKVTFSSKLILDKVDTAALLHWEEHCLECAPPDCYNQCLCFKERIDKKCSRLKYGFIQNNFFYGLYPYGIDCRFEKWGKIETYYNHVAFPPITLQRIADLNNLLSRTIMKLSLFFKWLSPTLKLAGMLNFLRNKIIYKNNKNNKKFDEFVFECYSPENKEFKIILQMDEMDNGYKSIFVYSFEIKPGHNFFSLSMELFKIPINKNKKVRIFLYPENMEHSVRLIITWLDFVSYRKIAELSEKKSILDNSEPASKIKCVAWDLDNTIWSGILEECAISDIHINPEVVKILDILDRRGILNTVISKNTYEKAWPVLQKYCIDKYFIFPAINWNSKSENLKEIAKKINIGIDSFAFIDDSPQERSEIENLLPMVRVFSEKDIPFLCEKEEFNVLVTEEAKGRRLSYQNEMNRIELLESFGENYDKFLYNLQMSVSIFKPYTITHFDRCLELLQRSNQLNLSTYRYSREEFTSLLNNDNYLCYAFSCADRFGDYGIIGFISIEKKDKTAIVHDLVISCRIAQKKIEQAVFSFIIKTIKDECNTLLVNLIKSKRNGPIELVLNSFPFSTIIKIEDKIIYSLNDFSLFLKLETPCIIVDERI